MLPDMVGAVSYVHVSTQGAHREHESGQPSSTPAKRSRASGLQS